MVLLLLVRILFKSGNNNFKKFRIKLKSMKLPTVKFSNRLNEFLSKLMKITFIYINLILNNEFKGCKKRKKRQGKERKR